MRIVPIMVDYSFSSPINLGKQGENLARQIQFMVTQWHKEYPEAVYQLYVTPPAPLEPYLAKISAENGVITWNLEEADTTAPGSGTVELILMSGDTKVKSVTYKTLLVKSPSSTEPGDAPQAHPTWWEGAIDKIDTHTTEKIAQIDGAFDTEAAAKIAEIEEKGKQTKESIPEDWTVLDADVRQLKDHKADAIRDTSAKAASHTLHAQNGPMSVTLHGKTTETGTGEKSPENPYTISGVGAVRVHAGGKNLLPLKGGKSAGVTAVVDGNGIRVSGTPTGNARIFLLGTSLDKGVVLLAGTYRLSIGRDAGSSVGIRAYRTKDTTQLASTGESFTLKEPTEVCVFLLAQPSYGTVTEQIVYPQLEIGSAATEYEPFNANVIEPPLLPDGAPLYGNGTVDDTVENDVIVDGERKCRVTRRWKKLTLVGAETELFDRSEASESGKYYFRITPPGMAAVSSNYSAANIYCNYLPVKTEANTASGIQSISADVNERLRIAIDGITTPDGLRTYLAGKKLEVIYPLATPEVYYTDPHELRKPAGLMPVTVTGSGETSVEYPHQTKHYIDSQIAAAVALALGN